MKTASPVQSRSSDALLPLKSIEQMVVDAGISPAAFLKSLNTDVKALPDPRRALNNLHRFLSAGFSATILRDFHQHRVLQQLALELFSQSQYLADILVRNPELFSWLTTTAALRDAAAKSSYISEARSAVAPFERFEKKLNALRRFQRRELLRIGAREILKGADISVTARELSGLADAVVNVVVGLVEQHLLEGSTAPHQSTFAVLGLGKLGGSELNFSSDIDLLFVYGEDGEFESPKLRIKTLHEYHARVAENVVRALTEHTGEGHLYRVDLRLRPEGAVGPIVFSHAAAMTYYETRGELWERQMLTKARVVAGTVAVGERLLHDLRPFVFPRTQSGSPLEEIAAIKRKIEAKTDAEDNIKLGSGGIRDIEFIVQALQLLNGGRNEHLRERNTLNALKRLVDGKLVNAQERKNLDAAYRFFRLVEHRLQLLHGMQTHSLPDSNEEMELLAKRLGFRSVTLFRQKLDGHRRRVRTIFSSIFSPRKLPKKAGASGEISAIVLKRYGFNDVSHSVEVTGNILESIPELRDPEMYGRLFKTLKRFKAPDWGLQNFFLLANNPFLRRSLLQALQNEKLLELLVLVCSRSSRLSQLLAQEPLLFETLLSHPEEVLSERFGWDLLKSDRVHYTLFNEFKVMLRWLVGESDIRHTTRELSRLADECAQQIFYTVLHDVCGDRASFPVALVAVGKYGGGEITVGSDLDLLVVYRKIDESTPVDAEEVARKFNAMFVHEGTTVYDIDMRLRPEGKSAPLAVELAYYQEYLRRRASLWERQSLVKCRALAGDEKLMKDVEEVAREFVYTASFAQKWVDEIKRMRLKIEHERAKQMSNDVKVGRGGLVDIEFLIQMMQMRLGAEHRQLQTQNTFAALNALSKAKLLRTGEVKQLQHNLYYLRSLETLVRLNSTQNDFVMPKENNQLVALAAGIGERSTKSLLKHLRMVRQTNRKLLLRVYKLCSRVNSEKT